jgi:hypothetical protein
MLARDAVRNAGAVGIALVLAQLPRTFERHDR